MLLLLQRSAEAVAYRGAFFRISGGGAEPARASIVLPPDTPDADDAPSLALLLGLAIVLGEPAEGAGAPIRQHWLSTEMQLQGKMGSEISPRHAAEAQRLAERIASEWARFLSNALARLAGAESGDAHFRFPPEGRGPAGPAVRVVAWPPLQGESLPSLD